MATDLAPATKCLVYHQPTDIVLLPHSQQPVAAVAKDHVYSRIVEHLPCVGVEEPRGLHHRGFLLHDIDLLHRVARDGTQSSCPCWKTEEDENIARSQV